MDYEKLKEVIAKQIKENGKREITGPVLQAVLMAMVDSLGEVYPHTYTDEEKAQARANIDALSNHNGEITKEKLSLEVQAILNDVANKQNISDATLATIAKTIVGAINEVYKGGLEDASIATSKIEDGAITEPKLDTDLVNIITSAIQPAGLASAIATALASYVAKADIVDTTGSATDKVMSQHGATEAIDGVTNKVTELEISTDRQINNIGYTLDKAAMSFDLEAGEHSSKKDVIYIDINAGETFDILLKNITSQNSGAASVFVHYDGDADTTNFGSVNIGTKKTFTTQRKITSIGFYMPSSVASSTGTMGVEISKIGSVKNSIDQKPDNVFLNIGNADEIKAGYSIYFSNGSLTTSSKATTYIFRNNDFKKVIADLSYNTSTMAAVAFYTGNTIDATTYDSTHSVKNFGSRHTYEIDVPDNCKLIAFVNRADYLATPSIEIRLKSLVGVSQRYEPKLEEINKNIGNATDIVSLNDPLNMGRKLNEIKSTRTNENLVLLHFSDIHAQANNLLRIKEFFSHYSQYINDVICTGDLLFNKWSDDFTYWENANVGDFMITIGNHETTTDASTWGNVPMADVNARFIAPYIGNWGVQHQTGKNYYYKDYTTQKIRLIVIDPYYDETAQTTWLESVLNDALTSELSVVIAEHNPFPTYTPLQTSFVSPYDTGVGALGNKIAAYMELVQNFHNNGGNFICWLCGHMHRDAVAKSVTYPNQLMVAVPATKIAESGNDDKRIAGTKSQDCFNVVSINPTHKTITIIRIGSDLDSLLRHKGTLCVNYENKEILWND